MYKFNNPGIKMTYSSDHKIISSLWKKTPAKSEIKEAMNYTIAIAKKHQTGRFIFNPAYWSTIQEEDKKWIREVFIPNIISVTGYAKIANVVPVEIFNRISKQEMQTTGPGMSYLYVNNYKNAIEWLKEENNQVKDMIEKYPCDTI